MYENKKIAVVVPAHNEEKLIANTIATIPDFVDSIIIINDGSKDTTEEIVRPLMKKNDKISLITHETNKGVGAAIKSGYVESLRTSMDIAVVMAGDGQMDPLELPRLMRPIIDNEADYTKGNRLEHSKRLKMPPIRRFGNSLLTLLTKVASGYWNLIDPQNGYTAISKKALAKINLDNIYDGYGCPNDILIELNIHDLRVHDIDMPPVYREEVSGIRIGRFSLRLSWLLMKGFFRRLNMKYGGLHFHPLWLFYVGGIMLFLSGVFLSGFILFNRIFHDSITPNTVLLAVLFLIMGYQSLLFAMFFDMDTNKGLMEDAR